MKTLIASVVASALLLGLGLPPKPSAPVLEGKDSPILLKRMVVTATPLPR